MIFLLLTELFQPAVYNIETKENLCVEIKVPIKAYMLVFPSFSIVSFLFVYRVTSYVE